MFFTNSFLFCVSINFQSVGSTLVQLHRGPRKMHSHFLGFPIYTPENSFCFVYTAAPPKSDFQFYRRNVSKTITRFFAPQKTTDIPHSRGSLQNRRFCGVGSSFLIPHSEVGSPFLVIVKKTADIISRFCLFYKFGIPVAVGEDLGRFSVFISYYRQVLAADHKVNVDHTFVNALLL